MSTSQRTGDSKPTCHKRAWGQGLVEFALILPVFMLLLLAAVDFGRLFFTYIQLNNIAREGAAYIAANPTTDNATLTAVASGELRIQTQRGEGTVTVAATCVDASGTAFGSCSSALGGTGAGNRVTVNVGETFAFFTPLIGNFWPGGLHVGASATAAVAFNAAGGGTSPGTCTTPPPTPTFTWSISTPMRRNLSSRSTRLPLESSQPVPDRRDMKWDFGGCERGDRRAMTHSPKGARGLRSPSARHIYRDIGCRERRRFDALPRPTISLGTAACNVPVANFTLTPQVGQNGLSPTGPHPGSAFTFDGTSSAFMSDPACHPVWSWNLGDGSTLQTASDGHRLSLRTSR